MPTSTCVTGATGFLGAHVAAAFEAADHEVRVTYRTEARLSRLDSLQVEAVEADCLDPASLASAFSGCELVVHVAGAVSSSDSARRLNAVAPRNAVEAASRAGAQRVLYTSSVVAIGPAVDGRLADEDLPYSGNGLGLKYCDGKHEGEVEAVRTASRLGVDLVVVNPAYVIGVPLDRRFTSESSAGTLLRFASGTMPALVDAATNVVDVRDVAGGHVLAAERGAGGRRYILGGHNRRWSELAEMMIEQAGLKGPVVMIPPELGTLARAYERLRLPGSVPGGLLARLAAPRWQYSSGRAQRELGYRFRPLEETVADIAAWARGLRAAGELPGVDDSTRRATSAMRIADRIGLMTLAESAARAFGRDLLVRP